MKQRTVETLTTWFCWASGLIFLSAVCCIIGFLLFKGYQSINLALIFGDTPPIDALLLRQTVFDGLFPAIFGTGILVALSIIWAVPIGITTGIYLSEYAASGTKNILNAVFDILAGIPSILVGLFGFSVAVFLHRNFSDNIRPCLLISSISLSFLVLPYIIRITQGALEGLPAGIRLSAVALGATRLQNILMVLLPNSLTGIISGVILAIGRCAEDTAVIMLTGAVVSAGIPGSLLSPFEALPFHIYYISSQYSDPAELARGYGASIILLAMCILLFSIAFCIKKSLTYLTFYRP